MEMEKKNLAIIILAVVLAASGVGNVILAIMAGFVQVAPPAAVNTIIIGYATNPDTIDPIDTWDVPSHNVEHQVIEGLVGYNTSDHPNYGIIPKLATDWHWHGANYDEISFELRQNVLFHDGTTFDADDVIWNFDRLTWFCNYSGTLQDNATSWLGFPSSLYWFSDAVTPIIADYYKNGQYNVTFELSRSFAPFLDLLTFVAGHIISPDSSPRWTYIDLTTGDLVGTGPFVYDSYEVDVDVRFHRNDDYWGEAPWAELLIFDVNEDDPSRNMDMLALKVDYLQGALPELLDTYNESIYHTVNRFGEGLCYFYFEFYCGSAGYAGLNVTWRKALQYAANYTYIIDEIYQGAVVRGPPAVPRLMPGHNASVQIIDTDITAARTLIASMFPTETAGLDLNYPGTTEAGWAALSLRTVQLNRHYGSTTNMRMNQNMDEMFALVGVDTYEVIRTWGEYLDTGENHPWDMEISYIGWCPDYLDAFNMLDPLFNNASHSNFAHVNDPYLQSLFDQASQQPDALLRQEIYMHIQSYLYEVTTPMHEWKYPHAPLFASLQTYVHSADLQGVLYNSLNLLECYSMFL
ncbi:MAG: ABC transporter substrate-binding protein [Promethearchaeota archaeon]|nr:MAG: ABC transporter substrate-binding protein [Candidatus Lokiarchaeota archaeon]